MATLDKIENREYIPKEWETVSCPVCNSSKNKIYERFGNNWQYTHRLCLDCKMVYCSPRPKYDEDFLYNAYEFYADDHSILNLDENEYESHALRATPGIEKEITEYFKFDKDKKSFIDIGCATGEYLFRAKDYYQMVFGLEVSSKMAEFVRNKLNIEVFTDKFEDLSENLKFSCIHMSHVIEHIPDPHVWLKKTKQLLTRGGILVIKVPNIFSPDRRFKVFLKRLRLRKGDWAPWRTPDHLFEPSIPGFRKLFELTGFEILLEHTYSRNNLYANSGFWERLYHRKLKLGNNIKYVVRVVT
ncbi:MAG: class I SAM-dependent methyltransferase [Leptospiraceae bacterium]|nr:class I SAM-dependent methyltransferase [Leptospiraceae bacterium]